MKLRSYIILTAATALMVGCQQNEDYYNKLAKPSLEVAVTEIPGSNWNTKARTAMSNAVPADTLWLNDSIYVEAVAEDIATEKTPITRATPVTDAKQITSLSIVMFNTKTAQWSATSSQETGKSPMKATFTNGSYNIVPPYPWFEEDMNYRTLIAMSPYHDSSGFQLSTNGQSLNVTVQNDVAQQYDLCVSNIELNKNIQYIIGSNSNQQKFEMAHMMTAVGFEAAGYDVMLTGVKFIGVNSENTLTLNDHTWSTPKTPANFEAKINSQLLNSEHIQSSNPWRNITPNDGYMMMIPQQHTDDMKLEFTFEGRNEQPGGTYTMQLNKILAAGATTSEWEPGMKVTYRLRLKTRPAVQTNNLVIENNLAGTTATLSVITSTDDDLTFSWTASWLGMYRGPNTTISNPESNGYFTPFTTGVNNWENVKFFARSDNKSTVADRTASVTVSGKKSGVRTFTVTQPKLASFNPPAPTDYVTIGKLRWAKGNLVAKNKNECKVGSPTDYGVYFQFGSLIGWQGGANGNGVGTTRQTLPVDKAVWPMAMGPAKPTFAWQNKNAINTSTLGNWYFNYSLAPWKDFNSNGDIGTFAVTVPGQGSDVGDLRSNRYANLGVGDPCSYYLGAPWRIPTAAEYKTLFGEVQDFTNWSSTPGWNWQAAPAGTIGPNSLFFPASGFRINNDGTFYNISEIGFGWSSSVGYATHALSLNFYKTVVSPQNNDFRSLGIPVRCVSPIQ